MIGRLVFAELRKLATVPTTWLLIGAQLVLVVAAISGASLHQDSLGLRAVLAHGGFTSLFTLVLGIWAVAGEHRHRTITDTYLTTPERWRVIAAKLGAYAAVGLVIGVASAVLTVGATAVWFGIKEIPFDAAAQDVTGAFVGIIAWNGLFALLGVCLGAIVTNLSFAIVVALGWAAVVETVFRDLLGDLGGWLPFAAGQALGLAPGAALSQTAAGLALAAYVVVFAAVAIVLTRRRDVA